MEFDWESRFECPECGETVASGSVEYNRLGYPICPVCGFEDGPLADQD